MNYSPKTNDALSLIKTLSIATGRYVVKHIHKARNKTTYTSIMKRCLPSTEDSIDTLQSKIHRQIVLADLLYKKSLLSYLYRDRYYHLMACSHATDVLNSIRLRFVNGEQTPEYKYLQDIGGIDYDDKSFYR